VRAMRRRERVVGIGDPDPIEDPRPTPPRPWRPALALLAVLVVGVVWATYDPVEPGGPTVCPAGSEEVPAGAFDDADAADFPDRTAICVVRNVTAEETEVTVAIRNDGPVAIDVSAERFAGAPDVFEVDEVAAAPADAADPVAAAEPVDGELTVPGDSEAVLVIALALPDCEAVDRPRVATFPELPLRATVLGLPRDIDLPLDPVLRVQAEECPPEL